MNNLFVISAPSATGKNAVYNELEKMIQNARRIVTCTTRPPRKDEVDGIDYYFYSQKQFEYEKNAGRFIEHNRYANEQYGTLRCEIEKQRGDNLVFLIVDINGKNNIIKEFPNANSIFILPPSIEELKKRILKRGENSDQDVAMRISIAEQEILESNSYDLVVVNKDVKSCAKEIKKFVDKKLKRGEKI